jgi:putative peptidoglycan binding protein
MEPAGQGDWVVESGDSMASIAGATGHFADTLWNVAENTALKEARQDGEILLPGDRVTVPPIQPKQVAAATGKRHVFKRKGVPVKFTLVLVDDEGSVFSGKKYELVAGDKTYSGESDDAGKIECFVDPASRNGELKVWLDEPGLPSPWTHSVNLGALYPVEHLIGVQQRLANLGFYAGELDGELTPATLAAANAFRAAQQIEPSGEIDDALRQKLTEVHAA